MKIKKTAIKKVTFEELDNYSRFLRANPSVRLSFNEYIGGSEEIIADLSGIKFDSKHRIDLSNINLSGCILDELEFSGEFVVLKGADLRGASIKGTKFTDHISLANTELGSIALNKDIFSSCQLKDAKYSPSESKTIMVEVTDKQLAGFLRSENINLNDYLSNLLKDTYPTNYKIIAGLKGRTIDKIFSSKDLSGSNLEEAIITGRIQDLQLRDCLTHNTIFRDCHLVNPDLRGTHLVDADELHQGFKAAIFEGEIILDRPIMSLGSKDFSLLESTRLLPSLADPDLFPSQAHSGYIKDLTARDIILDPCYRKGSNNPKVMDSLKCSREDVIEYAKACHTDKITQGMDFIQWMREKHPERWQGTSEDYVADLSEVDLSNIEGLTDPTQIISDDSNQTYSSAIFKNCNFSCANFGGTKLDFVSFKNCNLSGAKFFDHNPIARSISEAMSYVEQNYFARRAMELTGLTSLAQKIGPAKASLTRATFEDCDLCCATLDNIDATGAHFIRVIGYNLSGKGLVIEKGEAPGANLAGSDLYGLEAKSLKAEGINLSYANCQKAQFFQADLSKANLTDTNAAKAAFEKAKLYYANLYHTDLTRADLTDTELNYARMAANVLSAKMSGTKLKEADLAGLYGIALCQGIDFTTAIISVEQYQYAAEQVTQEIERNTSAIYNKYAIGIAICAVAIAVLIPAAIAALAPVAIAATSVAIVAPIVATAAFITISALVIDKAANYFDLTKGYINIIKPISNLLGAEKIINKTNKKLTEQLKDQDDLHTSIVEKLKTIPAMEDKIIAISKERETTNKSKEPKLKSHAADNLLKSPKLTKASEELKSKKTVQSKGSYREDITAQDRNITKRIT